jgi:hypothetical protein
MKVKILITLLVMLCLFTSCDSSKYDGLILTDKNTGKMYLLEHRMGDTYFIKEQILQISGSDTTYVFK